MASEQHIARYGHLGRNVGSTLLRSLVVALKEQVVAFPYVAEDELNTVTEDELALLNLSIGYETDSHVGIRILLQIVIPRNGRVVNGLGRASVRFRRGLGCHHLFIFCQAWIVGPTSIMIRFNSIHSVCERFAFMDSGGMFNRQNLLSSGAREPWSTVLRTQVW